MKDLSIGVAVLLSAAACAWGDGPSLTNEKSVFGGSPPLWKQPNQYSAWSARLSPDGSRMLYSRLQGEPPLRDGRPDWNQVMSELVLRDLVAGRDVVLPISTLDMGSKSVSTRFNPFDPTGRRMVLADVQRQETPAGPGATSVRTNTKLVLYDVASGKAAPGNIQSEMMLAKFNRAGSGLIGARGAKSGFELFTAALPGVEANALAVKGFIQSVCPSADVICVWTPPAVRPPAGPTERPQKGPQRLFLYDLKERRDITDLPIDQRNSQLDDYETQWTTDGNYLFYTDVEDDPASAAGGGTGSRTRGVSRIWDRQAGKALTNVPLTLPVGPGPTPSSMVLARFSEKGDEGGMLLYDAATGATGSLGSSSMKLVHACGARVLYIRTSDDKKETLYVADIVMPYHPANVSR